MPEPFFVALCMAFGETKKAGLMPRLCNSLAAALAAESPNRAAYRR